MHKATLSLLSSALHPAQELHSACEAWSLSKFGSADHVYAVLGPPAAAPFSEAEIDALLPALASPRGDVVAAAVPLVSHFAVADPASSAGRGAVERCIMP